MRNTDTEVPEVRIRVKRDLVYRQKRPRNRPIKEQMRPTDTG